MSEELASTFLSVLAEEAFTKAPPNRGLQALFLAFFVLPQLALYAYQKDHSAYAELGSLLANAGITKVVLIRHANAAPRDPEAAAVEAVEPAQLGIAHHAAAPRRGVSSDRKLAAPEAQEGLEWAREVVGGRRGRLRLPQSGLGHHHLGLPLLAC